MNIQIRFVTDEPQYAVPSTELSVPASIDPKGLNNLLRGLLEESTETEKLPDFSFIILNDLLKDSLEAFSPPKMVSQSLKVSSRSATLPSLSLRVL
ncbi:Ribosome biogenesis protein WDR12 -like protein [Caligus rogercresseyi]|uniref:Ribosome biogenesis protein WDR12 -like protein n=1 Tax=Caligus rogercresseyi TaxID=217165 RepID=A0A7T8KGW1_CALRO|nr:Ribosome biogenesis protein WDR12 -like protein [Caligus rogercresseyi]